jgi:hypothetical protein
LAVTGGFICADLIQIKIACRQQASASTLQEFYARSTSMMDIVMIAIGFVFFALSIGYVYACDRL